MQTYSSDHFSLQDRLLQCLTRCHGIYLRRRRAFPLSFTAPEDFRPVDRKFQDLKSLESTLPPMTDPLHPQLMSKPSTRLIDKCASLLCNLQHNRNVARNLTKAAWRSILVDYRQKTENIGARLEPMTGSPDLIWSYSVLKRFYHHVFLRAPKSSLGGHG